MKAIAVALVMLGFVCGCARNQAPSPQASSPSASPTDRPDLVHKTQSACVQAGRTWNATSGTCM